MKNYRNPLDMFKLGFDEYKELPKEKQDRIWRAFEEHVKNRGFMGLFDNYNQAISDGAVFDKIMGKWR